MPVVEPAGFRKHVALLRAKESNGYFHTLTSVMQYENASVVTLHIDWDGADDEPKQSSRNTPLMELEIGAPYTCRFDRAFGNAGHYSNCFVVTPPLPDDMSGIAFVFRYRLQQTSVKLPVADDHIVL
ncbi:hypothetical protein D3C84_886790 [compost metagenome]